MAFRPASAICDACVLYPFHQRNILVQLAADGLFDTHWTDEIHDEWMRHLLANQPSIPPQRLLATRQLMENALPNASVAGFYHHIEKLRLPDPDDRHVVAAAIEAKASRILTWNLRDFPAAELKKHGLIRQPPGAFICELFDQAPDLVVESLANARRNLSKSNVSSKDFIDIMKQQKPTGLEQRLREHIHNL